MTERYNPRRLKRDWVTRLAAGEKPRDQRQDAIERQAAFENRVRSQVEGARSVVHCRHDVPWLDCRVCSKPRSR